MVYACLNMPKPYLGIFQDFKKAFGTVSQTILLNKLDCIKIRGPALELLKSFLSDRSQSVKVTDKMGNSLLSKQSTITIGVSQDTVLGPLMIKAS